IYKPFGMVLVTGPTGSGKTTTLYSALAELNKVSTNISTAEDPIEFNLVGINQVQMHDEIGLNFAAALRAFLRQDPDVIMVGEIRDFETAEIGVKAALTGHLVLSTLHTNDAPSTVNRLLNMGVEPFLVASSINLIMAQRLARVICGQCKEEHPVAPEVLRELGWTGEPFMAYHGAGVPRPAKPARQTGRSGARGWRRRVHGAAHAEPKGLQFCRAGFAGRGTAFARSTERHTLASDSDPRHGLGSVPAYDFVPPAFRVRDALTQS